MGRRGRGGQHSGCDWVEASSALCSTWQCCHHTDRSIVGQMEVSREKDNSDPKGKWFATCSIWMKWGIMYTMEYYSAIKKNQILPFAATWMNLEIVILSEVRQRKTNTMWYCLYVESKKKMAQMNLFTKQSQRCRKQTWLPREKGEGRDKLGVGDWCTLTITYKIDN